MRQPLPSGIQMLEKGSKVYRNVFALLEQVPETRGDDRLLTFYYWAWFESWNAFRQRITFQKARMLTSPETIIRRRAEIQNAREYKIGNDWIDEDVIPKSIDTSNCESKWKYPHLRPSERTNRKRGAREDAIHDYFSGNQRLTAFYPVEA